MSQEEAFLQRQVQQTEVGAEKQEHGSSSREARKQTIDRVTRINNNNNNNNNTNDDSSHSNNDDDDDDDDNNNNSSSFSNNNNNSISTQSTIRKGTGS